ncbi:MAG: outer membrane protein assembly factor BamD, partial [Pseudomonadota bacterium]
DLASRYPKSRYFDDTMNQIVKLREKLAAYEIHAANYYLEHGSAAAALKRSEYVIRYYPRTTQVADALLVLVKAHKARGDVGKAQESLEALERNYPEHPATGEAKKVLAAGRSS